MYVLSINMERGYDVVSIFSSFEKLNVACNNFCLKFLQDDERKEILITEYPEFFAKNESGKVEILNSHKESDLSDVWTTFEPIHIQIYECELDEEPI